MTEPQRCSREKKLSGMRCAQRSRAGHTAVMENTCTAERVGAGTPSSSAVYPYSLAQTDESHFPNCMLIPTLTDSPPGSVRQGYGHDSIHLVLRCTMICMRLLLTASRANARTGTNSKKRKTQIYCCCVVSIEADMRRLLVAMNEVGGCRCNNAVRVAAGDGRYVIGTLLWFSEANACSYNREAKHRIGV